MSSLKLTNEMIALRLGYTLEGPREGMYVRYIVRDPEGKSVSRALPYMEAHDAWSTAFTDHIPRFLNDLVAALTLIPIGASYVLLRTRLGYQFVYGDDHFYGMDTVEQRIVMPDVYDNYSSPAEAVCYAWWNNH